MECKPDFLKPLELRPILRLGKNAIYEGIRTGQIPSVKVGDRYLIPRRKIEAMMGKDEIPVQVVGLVSAGKEN